MLPHLMQVSLIILEIYPHFRHFMTEDFSDISVWEQATGNRWQAEDQVLPDTRSLRR